MYKKIAVLDYAHLRIVLNYLPKFAIICNLVFSVSITEEIILFFLIFSSLKIDEYIRRFIPKGISFDNYTQDDINLIINHINSVKRDSLSGCNPYKLMKLFLSQEIIDFFNIEEIEQNKIIFKKII